MALSPLMTILLLVAGFVSSATFMGLFIAYITLYNNKQSELIDYMATHPDNGGGIINSNPSDEWANQTVYFVMIDRFNDGDATNNDQKNNEFDPNDGSRWSGGDLQGIIDKLDYIQGMGFTALWITPPVANQWWDEKVNYGGYHGYWARDFQKVDEHYGTIETYKALADALHQRDMLLIQDIVVNHTGNFFTYEFESGEKYDPENPCNGFVLDDKALAPGQTLPEPLNKNTCVVSDDAIYHWTPSIGAQDSPQEQIWTYQLSDLDDLNTSNPIVRKYLKDSYAKWINEVGVDAFRIDTAKYCEHDFWNDFIHADDGINAVAEAAGKPNFLTFGEVFDTSPPMKNTGEGKLRKYLGGTADALPSQLPSVINFPLYQTFTEVFATGRPTSELKYRIETEFSEYTAPHADVYIMPTFLDNHDTPRFLSMGSTDSLKGALLTLFTLPGIPVVYQGTEQEFVGDRDSMWVGGFRADGTKKDSFDVNSDVYKMIQDLNNLRRKHRSLSIGDVAIVAFEEASAGIFGYTRTLYEEQALVLVNTSTSSVLVNSIDFGAKAGTTYELGFAIHPIAKPGFAPSQVVVDSFGKLSLTLPANGGSVFFRSKNLTEVFEPTTHITIDDDMEGQIITAATKIEGTAEGVSSLKLVIDGNLDNATDVAVDAATGRFSTTFNMNHIFPGDAAHKYTLYSTDKNVAYKDVNIKTNEEWPTKESGPGFNQDIKVNGKGGVNAIYSLPTDATFNEASPQMSMSQVEYYTKGSNIKFTMTMGSLTNMWGSPFGFDHVGFTIFLYVPGQGEGTQTLPKMETDLTGWKWNRMIRAFGWGNAMYDAEGASKTTFGHTVLPSPDIKVDEAKMQISVEIASASLGLPTDLTGVVAYITTWDIEGNGNYRALGKAPALWAFSGDFDANKDGLVWDAFLM